MVERISTGRGPSHFREADVKRAIKVARAAGLDVVGFKVNPTTGEITILTPKATAGDEARNAVDEWIAEHAG